MHGTVKWFNDAKGYGFLVTDDRPETDIFVHFSVISGEGYRSLFEGQRVEFAVDHGPRGLYATQVVRPPVDALASTMFTASAPESLAA